MSESHRIDISTRPVGRNYGGKNGVSVVCPVCRRAAIKYKDVRVDGQFYTDYAHVISLDLNHKNEPRMTASEICRKLRDPSAKGRKGAK